MTGQYSLNKRDIEKIRLMLERYGVEVVYGIDNGKTIYNEIIIHISDEDGVNCYIQVD